MSRKDYERAAEIVRGLRADNDTAAPTVAAAFVRLFVDENPRFDTTRFLRATGGEL